MLTSITSSPCVHYIKYTTTDQALNPNYWPAVPRVHSKRPYNRQIREFRIALAKNQKMPTS